MTTARNTRILLPVAALVATVALPGVASAAPTLPLPQWTEGAKVSARSVRGGNLLESSHILGASTRARGVETKVPFCMVDGKHIRSGVLKKINSREYKVECPNGGKTSPNGKDYITESKWKLQERGLLPSDTVTIRNEDGSGPRRILCYGKVAGRALPGDMHVPPVGTLPTHCNVRILDNKNITKATDFGIYRYEKKPNIPGAGWWEMNGTRRSSHNMPLYVTEGDAHACRAVSNGQVHGGFTGVNSRGFNVCNIWTQKGEVPVTKFEVYVNAEKTAAFKPRPRAGHQWRSALNFSGHPTRTVQLCQIQVNRGRAKSMTQDGVVTRKPDGSKVCVPTDKRYAKPQYMKNFSLYVIETKPRRRKVK